MRSAGILKNEENRRPGPAGPLPARCARWRQPADVQGECGDNVDVDVDVDLSALLVPRLPGRCTSAASLASVARSFALAGASSKLRVSIVARARTRADSRRNFQYSAFSFCTWSHTMPIVMMCRNLVPMVVGAIAAGGRLRGSCRLTSNDAWNVAKA